MKPTAQPVVPKKFLRVATIAAMLDISKGQIWHMAKIGTFPSPRKLSPQITVWDANDVENWIATHLVQNETTPQATA